MKYFLYVTVETVKDKAKRKRETPIGYEVLTNAVLMADALTIEKLDMFIVFMLESGVDEGVPRKLNKFNVTVCS